MTGLDHDIADTGPLTGKVFEFLRRMERLVSGAAGEVGADYWAPLTEMVAVDRFRRRVPEDAFPASEQGSDPWARVVMDWPQYLECFDLWVQASPVYSNVVKRIAEFPGLVYLEIEEHHGGHIFNSLSVYEFDEGGRICGLRVAGADNSLVIPAGS